MEELQERWKELLGNKSRFYYIRKCRLFFIYANSSIALFLAVPVTLFYFNEIVGEGLFSLVFALILLVIAVFNFFRSRKAYIKS